MCECAGAAAAAARCGSARPTAALAPSRHTLGQLPAPAAGSQAPPAPRPAAAARARRVLPSRYEAGFACFDSFLERVTRSGEPLGYRGAGLRALRQLASLLAAAGSWEPGLPVHLVGFSKGGIVLNQVRQPAAALWLGG